MPDNDTNITPESGFAPAESAGTSRPKTKDEVRKDVARKAYRRRARKSAEESSDPAQARKDHFATVREKGGQSLPDSFATAGGGIIHTIVTQRNMKIHCVFAVLAIVLGFVCQIDIPSWLAIWLCIGIVFALEIVNTAIEQVVDLVSPEYNDLAGFAKDCAAGAVLVMAVISIIVAALVFGPAIGGM